MTEKNNLNIKYSKSYSDGSGEEISLEIDTKESDYQVKINESDYRDGLYLTVDNLRWLRDHIDKALGFIDKEK
jgi:hypothetical protein